MEAVEPSHLMCLVSASKALQRGSDALVEQTDRRKASTRSFTSALYVFVRDTEEVAPGEVALDLRSDSQQQQEQGRSERSDEIKHKDFASLGKAAWEKADTGQLGELVRVASLGSVPRLTGACSCLQWLRVVLSGTGRAQILLSLAIMSKAYVEAITGKQRTFLHLLASCFQFSSFVFGVDVSALPHWALKQMTSVTAMLSLVPPSQDFLLQEQCG